MTAGDLMIGINTVWVVIAAVLVMFMQAGFAFLEAGMTRMKNAGHVAAKNVLTFALCSLVYWAVGFGIAFGDGNALIGTSGYLPDSSALLSVGEAPFSFFTGIPGWRRLPVRGGVRRCVGGDRVGRHGRAGEALGLLRLRRGLHDHLFGRQPLGVAERWLAVRTGYAGLRRPDGRALPGRTGSAGRGTTARASHRPIRAQRAVKRDRRPQPPLRRAGHDHPVVRLVRVQSRLDTRHRLRRPDRLLRLRRHHHEPGGGRRWAERDPGQLGVRAPQARPGDAAERRAGRPCRGHGGLWLRRALGSGGDRRRRRSRGGVGHRLRGAARDRRSDRRRGGARHGRRLGHARHRAVRSPLSRPR